MASHMGGHELHNTAALFISLNRGRPCTGQPGPRLNIKTVFPCMGISMLKIRRSRDRLIFNIGIPILVRRHLYNETAPSGLEKSRVLKSHNESFQTGSHKQQLCNQKRRICKVFETEPREPRRPKVRSLCLITTVLLEILLWSAQHTYPTRGWGTY